MAVAALLHDPSGGARLLMAAGLGHRGSRAGATEPGDAIAGRTRVRRRAATLIAAAGLLDLASAVTPPLESRLRGVVRLVPLAVPQVATALVALAGLALLTLARGVRRGQRDAYRVAVVLLAGSALLHVVKGVDVEEAVAAAAVGLYVVAHRSAFCARSNRVRLRHEVSLVLAAAVVLVVGATATLEVVTEAHGPRLPFWRALRASTERLVGLQYVRLPDRLDDFATPALIAIGLGLLGRLAWRAIRTPAARRATMEEEQKARSIVAAWGSGALDYFALRSDKEFFFSGQTVVAYAAHHGVCLASPDPVGPSEDRAEVLDDTRLPLRP